MKKVSFKVCEEIEALHKSNHKFLTGLFILAFMLLSVTLSFASPTIYTYDEANRLIFEDRDGGTIEYLYDAVGNLTGRNFYGNGVTLTVGKAGDGNGTVTGEGIYQPGTYHQITATADADSIFTGWSGDCSDTASSLSVLMDMAKTCTAKFTSKRVHVLIVDVNGQGIGTVTSLPAGISCQSSNPQCIASFAHGALVTLTATPDANSSFAGWSGGCTGLGVCTVTMNAITTIKATFNPLKIIYPNGGDSLIAGSATQIGWTYIGNPGANVKIDLYKGDVLDSNIVSSTSVGYNGTGYYYWTVPSTQTLGTDYKIKITSTSDSSMTAISDGNFTIKAPMITVYTPNGGEIYSAGGNYPIFWGMDGDTLPVNVELYKGGVLDSTINTFIDVHGILSWTIPSTQTPSADYKIKVTSLVDGSWADMSDNNFEIKAPTITVIEPNGGESYSAGAGVSIDWTYTGDPGETVKIELYKGGVLNDTITTSTPFHQIEYEFDPNYGGNTWLYCEHINEEISLTTDETARQFFMDEYQYECEKAVVVHLPYHWGIPTTLVPGTDYKIKISSTVDGSWSDMSDNNFEIKAPTITVTSPNGGGSYLAGSSYPINLTNIGDPYPVNVELYKGGVFDSTIGTSNYGEILNWTIPVTQTPGTDYRIKVTSTINSSVTDMSDGNFEIKAPTIMVTAPNGGESYSAADWITVNWSTIGNPYPVKIELYKGGAFVSTLKAGTSNGNSYVQLPATLTLGADYQVKVTSTANSSVTDMSDGNFEIKIPTVTVTVPNGGESYAVGDFFQINWTYTGDPWAGEVKVELYKGGQLNTIITPSLVYYNAEGYEYSGATLIATWPYHADYGWLIPMTQTPGTDYQIKMTSTANSGWTDVSDGYFTISKKLTVSSSAGANGSISPNTTQIVDYNATTSFTITPDPGYHIASVDGCDGTLSDNTYIAGPITENCTVAVIFTNAHTVTPSAVSGGSISSGSAQTVNYNAVTSFTVTPNTGYHIASVTGCNGTLSGNTYTTGLIMDDCSVTADFAINTFTVNPGLDPDFNTLNGAVTYGGPANGGARGEAVAVQADGKAVVVGGTDDGDVLILRYETDGTLDNTFGAGGVIIHDGAAHSWDNGKAVAIQPDGKIVVAGTSVTNTNSVLILRYDADGTPDSNFGTNGIVTYNFSENNAAWANALALQSNGKIVVTGLTYKNTCADNSCPPNPAVLITRFNADGTIDNNFGTNGSITNDDGYEGNSVAVQPDGKIVVADDMGILRYEADGTFDVRIPVNGHVASVAIQPDRKIVAAGGDGSSVTVVRYNSDGSRDSSFGVNGTATYYDPLTGDGWGSSVVLQSDGKIAVAGNTYSGILVLRYNPDGTPDYTFGLNGIMLYNGTTNSVDQVNAVAMQPNDKIVVAGKRYGGTRDEVLVFSLDGLAYVDINKTSTGGGFVVSSQSGIDCGDTCIASYSYNTSLTLTATQDSCSTFVGWAGCNSVDGSNCLIEMSSNKTLSAGFETGVIVSPQTQSFSYKGGGGELKVSTSKGGCSWVAESSDYWIRVSSGNGTGNGGVIYSVDAMPENNNLQVRVGTITVAGQTVTVVQSSVADAGGLDNTFNEPNGFSLYKFSEYGTGVAIQPDGKIVVVGSYGTSLLALRYNADGMLDNSFGSAGIVTYHGVSSSDYGRGVAIQPDGKIVIVGSTNNESLLLLRYNANGTLDSDFGTSGVVAYNDKVWYNGSAVAIQPDGKIIAAGSSYDGTNTSAVVLRFNGDGSLDSNFGTGGVAAYRNESDADEYGIAVAIQQDGKIVLAVSGQGFIVRFNSDGTLDETFGTGGAISGGGGSASTVAIQGDGRIVVAGSLGDGAVVWKYNSDGAPDNSFGTGGIVTYKADNWDFGNAVAIQPDGKIVLVAGTELSGYSYGYFSYHYKLFVLRYNADGTADNTFGINGVEVLSDAEANAVAIQPDGMIVVVGEGHIWDQEMLSLRTTGILVLRIKGGEKPFLSVSKTGSGSGAVKSNLGGIDCGDSCFDSYEHGTEVTLTAVPVSGYFSGWMGCDNVSGNKCTTSMNASRTVTAEFTQCAVTASPQLQSFTAEGGLGSLEISTLQDGCAWSAVSNVPWINFVSSGNGMGNGIINYSVEPASTNISSLTGTITVSGQVLTVVRSGVTGTGGLDASFNGSNGATTYSDAGGSSDANAVAVQKDGKMVVAGESNGALVVLRYKNDGTLDETFGMSGVVNYAGVSDWHDSANAVAIQRDGKIVVAGSSNSGAMILRYNSDGTPDETFGAEGVVIYATGEGNSSANAVAIQKDGKIVVAGSSNSGAMILRYNSDGTPDETFGAEGVVIYATGEGNSSANAVATQNDGKIIVAVNSWGTAMVLRYNSDGTSDETFGAENGTPVYYGSAKAVAIQKDGKIVVTGNLYDEGGPISLIISRYNSDGTPDGTFGTEGITTLKDAPDIFYCSYQPKTMVIQPDGNILVAGGTDSDLFVLRYNTYGILDSSFGRIGYITYNDTIGGQEWANALALDPDGKIVAAGVKKDNGPDEVLVLRLNGLTSGINLLSVWQSGNGIGSVNSVPEGIDCGDVCSSVFDNAAIVTLAATPYSCSTFSGWAGCDSVEGNDCIITMNAHREVTADFASGFNITPQSLFFTYEGGQSNLEISTSQDGCGWRATSNVPWITITSDGSGTGSGSISYSVSVNTSLVPRTGTITVAGQTFSVNEGAVSGIGGLDTTFNSPLGVITVNNGVVDGSDSGNAVALQPDGKIVVAGSSSDNSTYSSVLVLRYNQDGTLDDTFGTGGQVTYAYYGWDWANAVAVQPDGKIVVAGSSSDNSTYSSVLVLRYNQDGTLDDTFGTGGYAINPGSGWAYSSAVALQLDGKIVVEGASSDGSILLLRYKQDGTLDDTFGTDGLVSYHEDAYDYGNAISLQPDGKIVVTGYSYNDSIFSILVLRYNLDGTLDNSFGTGMHITYPYEGWSPGIVTIQPDGKILATGQSSSGILIMRYNADGTSDNAFGINGQATYSDGSSDYGNVISLQPDGKIVILGFRSGGDNSAALAVRLNEDGTLDNSFGANGLITYLRSPYSWDVGNALAIQSDGKMVIVGNTNQSILVLRINAGSTGQHYLSSNKSGAGRGSVMSSETPVPFIACGETCSRLYNPGDTVTLTALASEGSTFTGWSGDCSGTTSPVTVTIIDRDMSCIATFTLNQHTLIINSEGNGNGTVGGGGTYDYGTMHAITATADAGSIFTGWSGDCSGKARSYSVTMTNADMICTASFALLPPSSTVTATAGSGGSISPDGAILVSYGTDRRFDITANSSNYISDIIVDGVSVGPLSSYTFTNVTSSHTIEARFSACGGGGAIYPVSQAFPQSGGTGRVGVSACAWTAGSNVPWITITSESSGAGYGTVTYSVLEGPNLLPRTGTITVASQTFAATQAAISGTGGLDTTFNAPKGAVTFNSVTNGGDDETYAMAIQPDGKIVVVGTTYGDIGKAVVLRYNSDGTLDTSFGTNGVTTYTDNVWAGAYAMAIQPDGKIVVTGSVSNSVLVLRYNSDGTVDNSFGTNGIVIYIDGEGRWANGNAMAIQPDGKILVTGTSSGGTTSDIVVLRYNNNGTPDNSFGINGRATYTDNKRNYGNAMAIQPDGRILVAATSNGATTSNIAVLRYNSDGTVDNSFGTNGLATYGENGWYYGSSMVIQPDGKIVVTGGVSNSVLVLRYNTDGTLDNGFGASGVANFIDVNSSYGNAVTIQPDGKIVVAGESYDGMNSAFLVLRYGVNGVLDNTFGAHGVITYNSEAADSGAWGSAVVLQSDGKIVVAGSSYDASSTAILLLRINAGPTGQHALLINKSGTGSGSVTSGETPVPSINCGTNCSSSYNPGDTVTLVAIAAEGSTFTGWSGSGCSGTGSCTVTTDSEKSATATFAANSYTVTPNAGPNGGLDSPVAQTLKYNETASFRVMPADGYHIASVNGCDGTLSGDTYTTASIKSDCTVTALFAINMYDIAVSAGPNGSINCTPTPVEYASGSTCTISPATGYHIASVAVDGGSQDTNSPYTFSDVTSAHSISAMFDINTFEITMTTGPNGSLTCVPNPVNYGSSSTCTISANSGYGIDTVTVDAATQIPVPSSYTFNDVQASHRIGATFEDTTAPALEISTITDGSWTSNSILNVSGTVSDEGSGLKSLTVNGTSATVDNGNFSSAVVLAEGDNTITAVATDKADNTTTVTRAVNYDSTLPVITITAPADNSATNIGTITISGSVDTNSHVTGVTVNGDSATFSADGLNFTAAATLSVGLNTIVVNASDLAGNTDGVTRSVRYDNVNPYVAVTDPNQDTKTNLSPVTIRGTVSDDVTIAALTISVDGGEAQPLTVTGGNFSNVVAFTTEKTYAIAVTATDEAGNTSIASRNIIYDATAPVTMGLPAGGTYDTARSVTLLCDDGSGTGCASTKYCLSSGCTPDTNYTNAIGIPSSTVLRFSSTDNAGNTEAIKAETYIFTHSLTVNKTGNGSGTIGGGGVYAYGSAHQTTASANAGSTFTGWSGDCSGTAIPLSVSMLDRDMTCTATFTLNQRSLTVNTAGNGSGTVQGGGMYDYGTTYVITATANTGSTFTGWSGDCSGSASPYSATMLDSNVVCTATFTLNTYAVSTSSDSNGSVTCSPNPVNYNTGSTCNISPNTGYHIDTITVDGVSQIATSTYMFNNVTATHTIAATFAIDDTTPPVTAATASGYTFGSWTSTDTVNVTLSPSDTDTGVAIGYPKYCVDTTNSCSPVTNDTTLSVTCAAGNSCTQYVRYYSTDNAGNGENIKSSIVKQDLQGPTLNVSTLSDNAWTNNGILNTLGNVSDDESGLQGLTINGVAVTVNPDSTFSHAVVLATGTNTITIIATDNTGNTTADMRTINYDSTLPVITITTPSDNSVTNIGATTISGSLDVNSHVTGLTNNLLPVTFSFSEGDRTFSASVALSYGTNNIEVEASDLATNTSTAKRTIIFDNVAPALAITNPPQDITTPQASIDVQGTVSDLTRPTVTISIDGGAAETLAITNGQFTKTVVFTTQKTYVIQVTAIDQAGNTSTVTRNVIYMIDTTPDQFTFTAQTEVALSTVTTSNTITVTGINSPAPISITVGTYSINGGVFTSSSGTVDDGDTVTVRQTSSSSYLTATDANLTIGGVSGTFSVTTTAIPPSVVFGASVNGLTVNVNGATSSCPSGACNYLWSTTGTGAIGNPTAATTTITYPVGGTFTITLHVTDSVYMSSATASHDVTVTQPNRPPVAAFAAGSPSQSFWTVSVTDASTDPDGYSAPNGLTGANAVTVTWGDGSYSHMATGGTVSHTYTVANTYTVSLNATDAAGLTSTNSCTYSAVIAIGTVTGTVKTEVGALVNMAKVTITVAGVVKTAYTDTTGTYTISNVKPGTGYPMLATKGTITYATQTWVTSGVVGTVNSGSNTVNFTP